MWRALICSDVEWHSCVYLADIYWVSTDQGTDRHFGELEAHSLDYIIYDISCMSWGCFPWQILIATAIVNNNVIK